MADLEYRCRICQSLTDNRICRECHARLMQPCTECGKPTATIKRNGQPALNTTCVACTARLKADTRRIGVTCKVCGERSTEAERYYQVCPSCQAITTPCPVCDQPMPKYRKAGLLRETCSNRCRKMLHPTTSEQARRGQRNRFANHVYKSHANRIARDRVEYRDWRKAVYERDNYTCQDCGVRSGNGKTVVLHPHHIKPFATYPDLRYEISNGVTLCADCHRKHHKHTFIGRSRKQAPGQLRLTIAE